MFSACFSLLTFFCSFVCWLLFSLWKVSWCARAKKSFESGYIRNDVKHHPIPEFCAVNMCACELQKVLFKNFLLSTNPKLNRFETINQLLMFSHLLYTWNEFFLWKYYISEVFAYFEQIFILLISQFTPKFENTKPFKMF